MIIKSETEINIPATYLTISWEEKEKYKVSLKFAYVKDGFKFFESFSRTWVEGKYFSNNQGLTVYWNSENDIIEIFYNAWLPENEPRKVSIKYHYTKLDEGEIFDDYWVVKLDEQEILMNGNKKMRIYL